MSSSEEKHDRHAVPRLRSFAVACEMHELSSLKPLEESPFTDEMLRDAITDWEEKPGVSVAADLVSAAITLGRLDVAKQAALYLLSKPDAPPIARRMAGVCVGAADGTAGIVSGVEAIHAHPFSLNDLHSSIHRTRIQLRRYPRDSVLWTNLACMYVSLGQHRKARRAVVAALSLSPQNRFVVRSASRILLHLGEGDLGHLIVLRTEGLRYDPWLASAEISIAAAIKSESDFIKSSQKLLEADKFAPYDSSELAVELATIRGLDGNMPAAKRLFRRSLQHASENALAQAAWLAREVPGIPAIEQVKTHSSEANAWITRQRGHLRDSLLQTRHWLEDQPFSSRPAEMGSFIASRLTQHEDSIQFARQGLVSNPDDVTLLNNLAFSLGKTGDVAGAKDALSRVNAELLSPSNQIVLDATRGLIAFREGNVNQGRILYDKAITLARARKDPREAIALIYRAMEEIQAATPDAEKHRGAALEVGRKQFVTPEDRILIGQLEKFGRDEGVVSALPPQYKTGSS